MSALNIGSSGAPVGQVMDVVKSLAVLGGIVWVSDQIGAFLQRSTSASPRLVGMLGYAIQMYLVLSAYARGWIIIPTLTSSLSGS